MRRLRYLGLDVGTTLFWMAVNRVLPKGPFTASFLPDYVGASLTGTRPVTDATDAAGSGLFEAGDPVRREPCLILLP